MSNRLPTLLLVLAAVLLVAGVGMLLPAAGVITAGVLCGVAGALSLNVRDKGADQ